MFVQNESDLDKRIRLIIGAIAFLLALFTTGTIQILAFIVAALAIFTGLSGFCLLYKIFGISTKAKKS
jgi:hypothetical protein